MTGKYIESETLELKEKYTDTLAKEIVSFLNSNGGTIFIGIRDDGTIVGVAQIDETLRKISDIITNQIEPNPQDEITAQLKFEQDKTIIAINVNKGHKYIYCQKKYGFSSMGCTIRIGTTCKGMTPEQIGVRYEKKFIDTEYMLKKRSSVADLSFRELKIYYSEKNYHLDDKSFEANLNLRNDLGEYNLLAELLSDRNNVPFIFVKFKGEDKACISETSDYGYGCILTTYEKIRTRLQSENIKLSDTTTRPRKDVYLFDFDCVNEAILNAIVHNDWTITEPQISMFSNRLEILSHGGLPSGMTEKEFFAGISRPRNATLMRIFLNMRLTEHTGHGIPTIVDKYGKECFDISSNYIRCTIPFNEKVLSEIKIDNLNNSGVSKKISEINGNYGFSINETEKSVVKILINNSQATTSMIAEQIGVTRRTVQRAIASLRSKGIVEKVKSNNLTQLIVKR